MDEYHAARVGSESDAILVVEYSNRTLSLGDFVPFADAGTTPSAKHQSSVVVSAETSTESQSAGSSQPTVSKRPAPAKCQGHYITRAQTGGTTPRFRRTRAPAGAQSRIKA
jgi:hypothetical protein